MTFCVKNSTFNTSSAICLLNVSTSLTCVVDDDAAAPFGTTSWILSARSGSTARGDDDCDAIIDCMLLGRRLDQIVRKNSPYLRTLGPVCRYLRNCDGFLLPNSSWVRSWCTFFSLDSESCLISSFFSRPYLSSAGGFTMISSTSVAYRGSRWLTT